MRGRKRPRHDSSLAQKQREKSNMAIANKRELVSRLAKKMHLPSKFNYREWDRLARRQVATLKNNGRIYTRRRLRRPDALNV